MDLRLCRGLSLNLYYSHLNAFLATLDLRPQLSLGRQRTPSDNSLRAFTYIPTPFGSQIYESTTNKLSPSNQASSSWPSNRDHLHRHRK